MQRMFAQLNNMQFKLIPLVLILVLVVSIIGPGVAQADPGWYNASWLHRKKITIESDEVNATLNNFPVLISLASDSDLANDARNDGYDILFTDNAENKLKHEIESFNGTTGQLRAWVKIPTLSSSVDTEIYMYYDYATSGDQQEAADVWDTNYKLVDHMQDDPDNSHTSDSTSNNHDGTKCGANEPVEAEGKIAKAQDFDGTNDYISYGTPAGLTDLTYPLTFECIAKPDTLTQNGIILSFDVTDANSDITFGIWGSKDKIWVGINTYQYGLTGVSSYLTAGVAKHWTIVFTNATSISFYLNGVAQSLSDVGNYFGTNKINVGARADGTQYPFNGIIDEVRISNKVRDADWILTSYKNQFNPADFHSLGSEETLQTPTVTTNAATLVEDTTATLNGTLDDDGNDDCEYRFQWGTTQGGPYTDNISWTGSLTDGQTFSHNLSGLNKGTRYYFIAEAKNGKGTSSGSELYFVTKPDPPPAFSATTISNSRIDLSWTKAASANNTMVRRQEGSSPTSVTEGDQVYFSTGSGISDTGLSAGTTYFYSAWSEVSGSSVYSGTYATANTTTSGAAPTVIGGIILSVNKATVLAPWLFLVLILSLVVITRIILHFRKRS